MSHQPKEPFRFVHASGCDQCLGYRAWHTPGATSHPGPMPWTSGVLVLISRVLVAINSTTKTRQKEETEDWVLINNQNKLGFIETCEGGGGGDNMLVMLVNTSGFTSIRKMTKFLDEYSRYFDSLTVFFVTEWSPDRTPHLTSHCSRCASCGLRAHVHHTGGSTLELKGRYCAVQRVLRSG